MASRKTFLPPIDPFIPPPPPPPPPSASHFHLTQRSSQSNYHQLKANAVMILLLILAVVFLLSLSLHLLLRLLERRRSTTTSSSSSGSSREAVTIETQFHHHHSRSSSGGGNGGFSLVDSLPVFSFASITSRSNQRLDCAVCLSPFQSNDRLRLLPYCTHAFHADCIGTWLLTNSTCPLCRSDLTVAPAIPTTTTTTTTTAAGGGGNEREEVESVKSSVGGRSFRLELGSISSHSIGGGSRRSYSMGSFEYVVPENSHPEVFVADRDKNSGRLQGFSWGGEAEFREMDGGYLPEPKMVTVGGGNGGGTSRNWLREYLERLVSSASSSLSMRTTSFRSSNDGRNRPSDGCLGSGREPESHSDRLTAAAESFLLFLRSDM